MRRLAVVRRLVLSLLAATLLLPWPIAYAYDASFAGQETPRITAAEPDAVPGLKAFGKAIGGVTPGDLFYIDCTDSPVDRLVTLQLTNAEELVHCYRYMILEIGLYLLTGDDRWEKVDTDCAGAGHRQYISMRTGEVGFILHGDAEYKLTIDGGCFYCFTASGTEGFVPRFYLTME
jgi:hypothetical protein